MLVSISFLFYNCIGCGYMKNIYGLTLENMEEYFESKLKLFDMCKYAFINADNLYTAKVPELIKDKCTVETYGIDNYCNFLAKDVTITNTYADFKVKLETRNERVKVSIPGRFSVYNALAAIRVAQLFGANTDIIQLKIFNRSKALEQKKLDRINELARLAKERELTEAEKAEQAALRAEYIAEFRKTLRGEEKK